MRQHENAEQRETMSLRSIGRIEQNFSNGMPLWEIAVQPEYRDALEGLEGFSHIQVLWWAHQLDGEEERSITLLPKPYKNGPEMIGVFATRSPLRPNPLALSACPVHSVDGPNGIVRLHYIDADVGSPVLDIKPYLGATDRIRNPSFPEWCSQWPSWMEDSANFDWGKVFENAR